MDEDCGWLPPEDYNWKYKGEQTCKHKGICTYYNKEAYSDTKPSNKKLEPVPENADECIKEDGSRTNNCEYCSV